MIRTVLILLLAACAVAQETPASPKNEEIEKHEIHLPTSKLMLAPVPGAPQQTNSFPTAMVVSPDEKYLAVLNNGFGTVESNGRQSIAILDVRTNELKDFPDPRLGLRAQQSYFLGLAWSSDGKHLYASVGSITDPLGEKPGNTGNGIAVYSFENGVVAPERFIKIGLQQLAPGKKSARIWDKLPEDKAIPYPAGIAVARTREGKDRLLVADNLSDDAVLIDAETGNVLHRFDLSTSDHVPASYPLSVAVGSDSRDAVVSLWNASRVAVIDLTSYDTAQSARSYEPPSRIPKSYVSFVPLRVPETPTQAGSHPAAIDHSTGYAYVTLSTRDEVAIVDPQSGEVVQYLSTKLPNQKAGGTYPISITSSWLKTIFVANASTDGVAVFRIEHHPDIYVTIDITCHWWQRCGGAPFKATATPIGFIPTEWYPTALAVSGNDLFIASGKGQGTGPNNALLPRGTPGRRDTGRPFIASLLHGSIARVKIDEALKNLPALTAEVERSNLMAGRTDRIEFAQRTLPSGRVRHPKSPIKHVIYVIKENRSYDQVFGDIAEANGDSSLVMYGEDITPNQHKLARQFGVLDNFYDSGEISGNGHVWSTAAITSDYTEKTWQIGYRSRERTYDYEGMNANRIPLDDDIPDVNEPGTGYVWTNLARNHRTYRHYGEYVTSRWCNDFPKQQQSPMAGTPLAPGATCPATFVKQGEVFPNAEHTPSPYPWPVPILARNDATKPELRGHFDPNYADFRMDYPDQLRADEFLHEFNGFVKARAQKKGKKYELPEFVVLRLPNDHTSGTRPGFPTPTAAMADNDLALGRVVDAVSHSPYWDDTAIFVLEDDAQDGADHVDAHRSIALVISKYAPKASGAKSFVESTFYTTVNLIHTMEVLLGLPPMNNNDARAAVMAPLFGGDSTQPAFTADYRNRENGMLYEVNSERAQGARESATMDFTHADSVDTTVLNAILWRDRKGDAPMPKPVHTMCGKE